MPADKIADLSPAELDIRIGGGDDINLALQFSVSLAAWGGFAAQARPDPESTTKIDFGVNTSQIATDIITLTMAGALSSGICSGWHWSVYATAPSRRTICRGRIFVEPAVAR